MPSPDQQLFVGIELTVEYSVAMPVDLASAIEHTCLRADATHADVDRLVDEAMEHGLFGVCVAPRYVARARTRIGAGAVRVVTVAGFPLSGSTARIKAQEAAVAVGDGADEVDMVIAIGEVLAGSWDAVRADVDAVRSAVRDATLKVILETCYLTQDQMRQAAVLCVEAGAQFVKTSTGFGPRGATVEDVAWLSRAISGRAGVKASGGIRTREEAERLVHAGATRIGTSRGAAMVAAR